MATVTESQLEKTWPHVEWRQPLPVQLAGTDTKGLACRFCLAIAGLKGTAVAMLPQTLEQWQEHMRTVHKINV